VVALNKYNCSRVLSKLVLGFLKQPKVFGVKSLREIGRIFSIQTRNFKLGKMPKSINFRFPEG